MKVEYGLEVKPDGLFGGGGALPHEDIFCNGPLANVPQAGKVAILGDMINKQAEQNGGYAKSFEDNGVVYTHHFGNGLYLREMFLPKGKVIVGLLNKFPRFNMISKGKMRVETEFGGRTIEAPLILRDISNELRLGFAIEDCVFTSIFSTHETGIGDERDIGRVEEILYFSSDDTARAYADRADFSKAIMDIGLTEGVVRAISETETDMTSFIGTGKVGVEGSRIEGKGLFLREDVGAECILAARIDGKRTVAGRYVNHSATPNCVFVAAPNGDLYLHSVKPLKSGTELTLDYRQSWRENMRTQCLPE